MSRRHRDNTVRVTRGQQGIVAKLSQTAFGLLVLLGVCCYYVYFFKPGDEPFFLFWFLLFGLACLHFSLYQLFGQVHETMEITREEIRFLNKKEEPMYGLALRNIRHFFIIDTVDYKRKGEPRYLLYARPEEGPPWFLDSFGTAREISETAESLHALTGKAMRDHGDLKLNRKETAATHSSAAFDMPTDTRGIRRENGEPRLESRDSITRACFNFLSFAAATGFMYLFQRFLGDGSGIFHWIFKLAFLLLTLSSVRSLFTLVLKSSRRLELRLGTKQLTLGAFFSIIPGVLNHRASIPLHRIKSAGIYRNEQGNLVLGAVVDEDLKPMVAGGFLRIFYSLIPMNKISEEAIHIAVLHSGPDAPFKIRESELKNMRAMEILIREALRSPDSF